MGPRNRLVMAVAFLQESLDDLGGAIWPVMPQMFDAVISLDNDLKEGKDQ